LIYFEEFSRKDAKFTQRRKVSKEERSKEGHESFGPFLALFFCVFFFATLRALLCAFA
jgi:hypothetical protein